MRIKISHILKTFLIAICLLTAVAISAAPGDLDATFGSGGIVVTAGSGGGVLLDSAQAMAIQSDGKIVVVGDSSSGFAIVRYNTNGSLDTSFGETGIVSSPPFGRAFAVLIQADGKIVVVGGSGAMALARYNPDGSLDTSFGGTGIVGLQPSGFESGAYAGAIQSDGRIVIAGTCDCGQYAFTLVRFNTDGSLDYSFNGGVVITSAGDGSGALSLTIQPDGKIVAAGNSGNGEFAVVRYHPNGLLDTSFGNVGVVTTQIGETGVQALAIQSDGKIVAVGGSRENGLNYFTIVRYNADSSLDTSLNRTGIVLTPVGSCGSAHSIALQSDGKMVAAGSSCDSLNIGTDFAVFRYNENGSLDTTFNGTGKSVTPLTGGNDHVNSVVIQSDGKIVTAGRSGLGWGSFDFTLARYLTAPDVHVSGRVTTPEGRGLRNATVTLTDPRGVVRTATTGSFGRYTFDIVRPGESYLIGVSSKRYRFTTRTIEATENLADIDFVGAE